MNKKVLLIIVTILVVGVIIGIIYFLNNKKENVKIDIEELSSKIIESGAFEDTLEKVDSTMTINNYNFMTSQIKEIVSYQGSGATSEEIVVIQVNEKNNINSIKERINERLDERKEAFASYLPKEVYKIENNVLKVKGNYVILCISNDAKKVSDAINNYIKE